MEHERRYLVLEMDPSVLGGLEPDDVLVQGYFLTPSDRSVSIRVSETRNIAWIRPKFGQGISREDALERQIDVPLARLLLVTSCPDRLQKRRYRIPVQGKPYRHWDVDAYAGALSGLVVVERELESTDEPVEKPAWVRTWIEVTDVITNQHLARMATELHQIECTRPVHEYVLETLPVPAVVLAGGPCSGKSKALGMLHGLFPDIHTVPEVATILIGQVGVHPPIHDRLANRRFQKTVYHLQRAFEEESSGHARRTGKQLLVTDRGTLEGAAYMNGGIPEFLSLNGTTAERECSRYLAVVFLETPSRSVYEAKRGNNGTRSEDYGVAMALSERISAAWSAHPRFIRIPAMGAFDEKLARIADALRLVREAAP